MTENGYSEDQVWVGDMEDVIDVQTGDIPIQDMSNPQEAIDVGSLNITLQPGQ